MQLRSSTPVSEQGGKSVEQRITRKRNCAFLLRLTVFLLLFMVVLAAVAYVLMPKYDYGPGSMMNYYLQQPNTIDVLALGTSLTYAAVNTNALWANWGIAAYNLASAEQQYWNTYYYLKEALKSQHPKLIILDAKATSYRSDETLRGRTIMTTFGILSPDNRFESIRITAPEEERNHYYYFFPVLHENWKDLSWDSFQIPGWTGGRSIAWKGFVEAEGVEKLFKPQVTWDGKTREINAREMEYLEKICDLAKEYDIPILLVGYPFPDYDKDHLFYNALWEWADERGIPHVNFNYSKDGYSFLYTDDFADAQHVNISGSIKVTKYLGEILHTQYDLPDHRGDPRYSSWDDCLTEWKEKYPDFAQNFIVEEM